MRAWPLLLVGLSCNKADAVDFHRIELPGFSLEVPTCLKAPKDPDYRSGNINHKQYPTVITVTWQAGEPLTVDEMAGAVRVIMSELPLGTEVPKLEPAKEAALGGNKAVRLDASIGSKVKMSFVDVKCGKRSVMIGGVGLANSFPATRDRVLRSFQCKPVESEEASLDSKFGVGSDDPKHFDGWRYSDEDRSTLTITNDKVVVVFSETTKPKNVELEQVRNMLPKLIGVGGGTFTKASDDKRTLLGGERRHFDIGTMTAEGETLPAITTIWLCPDGSRAVIALALSVDPEVSTASTIDWLSKVRCAKANDPPLAIAPFVPEDAPTE